MRTIRAVVPRPSRDEHTFAVVEAQVDDDFGADEAVPRPSDGGIDPPADATVLWGHLQLAVTEWFHEADAGKAAIRGNHDDSNVGDLAEHQRDETLIPFLWRQGIRSLAIETYADASGHIWEYDDVLFDETEVTR